MRVKFENGIVDLEKIKKGSVVYKFFNGCNLPGVYHVKNFVGLCSTTPTVNLIVEDNEGFHFYNSSELVWP